jgi:CHRD domain
VNFKLRTVYQLSGLFYKKDFSITHYMFQIKTLVLCILILVIFCISVSPTLSNSGYEQKRTFTAQLGGNQEIPPNTSIAKGWAWFTQKGNTIWYKLNVTGLDMVVGAHIHNGKADENGDPVVTLFHVTTPTDPVNGTLVEGNLTSADLAPVVGFVNKMEIGETYVNIHTVPFPTGEIRGQIYIANASATMLSRH